MIFRHAKGVFLALASAIVLLFVISLFFDDEIIVELRSESEEFCAVNESLFDLNNWSKWRQEFVGADTSLLSVKATEYSFMIENNGQTVEWRVINKSLPSGDTKSCRIELMLLSQDVEIGKESIEIEKKESGCEMNVRQQIRLGVNPIKKIFRSMLEEQMEGESKKNFEALIKASK